MAQEQENNQAGPTQPSQGNDGADMQPPLQDAGQPDAGMVGQQATQPVQPPNPYVPQATQPVQTPNPYVQPAQAAPQQGQPTAQQNPYQQAAPVAYQPVVAYQPGQQIPRAASSSSAAIGSLVCGILAIVFSWTIVLGIALGIVAIILGFSSTKKYGSDAKALGGKVCGIIGMVFSVAILAFSIWVGVLVWEEIGSSPSSYSYSSSGTSSSTSSNTAADEKAVREAATAAMEKLKNPDAALQKEIADEVTESVVGYHSYTMADLGLDANDLAKQLSNAMTYQIDSVSAYGDSAYVTVKGTTKDVYTISGEYLDAALDKYIDDELDYYSPSAADKPKLAALYQEAFANTAPESVTVSLSFTKKNGSWVLSDSSLTSAKYSFYSVGY